MNGPRARRGVAAMGVAAALSVGLFAVPGDTGGGPPPAAADSVTDRKRQIDNELARVREDLEGTAGDLVDAAVALKRAELQLVDARAAVATAEAELAEARRKDAELATRLAVAQAEERKAGRELGERQEQERQTRTTLGQIAREAYLSAGLSSLSVALDAQSPEQFTERMAVAGTALRVQSGAIARLDVQQAESRARTAKLEALRAQVAELKRQAEALVRARQAAEARAQAAKVAVERLVAEQAQAVTIIEARKAAEQARLDSLEAEQAQVRAILAARARAAAEAARRKAAADAAANRKSSSSGGGASSNAGRVSGGGVLDRPASGPVTSGFGYRIHPIFGTRRLHTGTDFGIACGTPVRASAAGTVVLAGWSGGYGNRIVVDHGLVKGVGLGTTYNHLSSISKSGGSVSRGQLIGYSGTTGSSTGCHLHFEVLVNGSYVNPMGWL